MRLSLLSDLACVYLEVSPVCRGSERWGRLCLLMNKGLGPGTPKIAICLFLLLSPFWHVGLCGGGGFGGTSGLRDGISIGPYFSIRNC